jgi:hypothetical protein
MNVVVQAPWTVERFLDWAARQEDRHEFDGTQLVAMGDGTGRHSRITVNIHLALGPRLRRTAFAAFG